MEKSLFISKQFLISFFVNSLPKYPYIILKKTTPLALASFSFDLVTLLQHFLINMATL